MNRLYAYKSYGKEVAKIKGFNIFLLLILSISIFLLYYFLLILFSQFDEYKNKGQLGHENIFVLDNVSWQDWKDSEVIDNIDYQEKKKYKMYTTYSEEPLIYKRTFYSVNILVQEGILELPLGKDKGLDEDTVIFSKETFDRLGAKEEEKIQLYSKEYKIKKGELPFIGDILIKKTDGFQPRQEAYMNRILFLSTEMTSSLSQGWKSLDDYVKEKGDNIKNGAISFVGIYLVFILLFIFNLFFTISLRMKHLYPSYEYRCFLGLKPYLHLEILVIEGFFFILLACLLVYFSYPFFCKSLPRIWRMEGSSTLLFLSGLIIYCLELLGSFWRYKEKERKNHVLYFADSIRKYK